MDMCLAQRTIPPPGEVRTVWRSLGMDVPDTPRAISNLKKLFYRLRTATSTTRPATLTSTLEFAHHCQSMVRDRPDPERPAQLTILPQLQVDESAGLLFVPFTCHAFLAAAQAIRDPLIPIVVDGKWKVLNNRWVIISLGYMRPSSTMHRTTLTRVRIPSGRTFPVRHSEICSSFAPVILALANAESNIVVDLLFSCLRAHWLPSAPAAPSSCPIHLRVGQLHKDFAASLEHGRREHFPVSRPCADYSHYSRRIQVLRKQAGVGRVEASALHVLSHCSRYLPTLELFSAIWQHQQAYYVQRCMCQVDAFLGRYFSSLPPAELARIGVFRFVTNPPPHPLLVAGWHSGCFTILPGTSGGSQCIEAYHRGWQNLVHEARTRTPQVALQVCDRLFHRIAESMSLSSTSLVSSLSTTRLPIPANLLRPNGWIHIGEPTAYDFWRHQNAHNHLVIHSKRFPRTAYVVFVAHPALEDIGRIVAREAVIPPTIARIRPLRLHRAPASQVNTTSLNSLRDYLARQWATSHPASSPVDASDAQKCVDLLELAGDELVALLRRLRVLPATPTASVPISIEALRQHLMSHFAVIVGSRAQLPSTNDPSFAALLCTCPRFSTRGRCQHTVFVSALDIAGLRQPSLNPPFSEQFFATASQQRNARA